MLYEAERGDISIAVVGDAMLSRRLRAFHARCVPAVSIQRDRLRA